MRVDGSTTKASAITRNAESGTRRGDSERRLVERLEVVLGLCLPQAFTEVRGTVMGETRTCRHHDHHAIMQ